jgi:hypothetical protein
MGTLINDGQTAYWQQIVAFPALTTSISKLVRRTGPWLFTDDYQSTTIFLKGFMLNVEKSENDGIPGYTVLVTQKN